MSRAPGGDASQPGISFVCALQAKEVVDINGSVVTVTDKGRLFVRAVCAVFDQYLQPAQRRYSLSV